MDYFDHLFAVLNVKLTNGEFDIDFSSAVKAEDGEHGSNYAHSKTFYLPQWKIKKPNGYKSIADIIEEIIELATEISRLERPNMAWAFNRRCQQTNMFDRFISYYSDEWTGCMGVSRTYVFIDGSKLEYASWEGSETRLNQPWILNQGDYLYTDREP